MRITPTVEVKDSIDGFWETIRDDYPQYSKEQVELAIRSFFNYVKVSMESSSLPEIRIKYFGHFFVKTGKIQAVLRNHIRGLNAGKPSEFTELVKFRIRMLTRYLQKHDPEKLVIPEPKQEGEGYTSQYILLPSGEFEVQAVLCEKPPAEMAAQDTHPGANKFPDFLHGLNMLFGR
jgi:hypothetical protein